jgi:hypothetical protein
MDQYALTSDLVIGDKSLDPTGREGLQQFVFFSKFHTSIAIPLKIDATSDFSNLSTEVKARTPLQGRNGVLVQRIRSPCGRIIQCHCKGNEEESGTLIFLDLRGPEHQNCGRSPVRSQGRDKHGEAQGTLKATTMGWIKAALGFPQSDRECGIRLCPLQSVLASTSAEICWARETFLLVKSQ